MPQVKVDGKVKHLPYTPEGMATAKRLALRTGGKLKKRKKTVGTRPDTLLNTYKKTQDNVVKQHPVTGLDYMKVPELEYDRQQRLKKEENTSGSRLNAEIWKMKKKKRVFPWIRAFLLCRQADTLKRAIYGRARAAGLHP